MNWILSFFGGVLLAGERELKLLWRQRNSRQLLAFVLVLFVFFWVQVLYGYWHNHLAMVALAFCTCFNLTSLALNLFAFVFATSKPSSAYTYGFQRYEVVLGFTHGICHAFSAVFILFEVLEHFVTDREPSEASSVAAGLLAGLGIILNLVAVFVFRSHRRLQALELRGGSSEEAELDSFFWTLLTNLVPGVAVIGSTLMTNWGLDLADTLMAGLVSCLLLCDALPLARNTGKVLLHTTPSTIKDKLDKCLREASMHEGVLECHSEHFWTLAPNEYVGSFHVRIKPDTDEQLVLSKLQNLFSPFITHLTIQVEKEEGGVPCPHVPWS